MPVLRIDDKEVLFESAVINEYLDEITPPQLMPSAPLSKAKHRAWIEFASALSMKMGQAVYPNQDETAVAEASNNFFNALAILEKQLGDGPYFAGENFSLVDTALAPIFMRVCLINHPNFVDSLARLPKSKALAEKLLNMDAVKNSVRDDFAEDLKNRLAQKGSPFAEFIQT